MKKRMLAMVMALCLALSLLPVTAGAEDVEVTTFSDDTLNYAVTFASDGTGTELSEVKVIGFGYGLEVSYSGDITIPETVTHNDVTYSVTEIDYQAFFNSTELNSIKLPKTIKLVDANAFQGLSLIHISEPTRPY